MWLQPVSILQPLVCVIAQMVCVIAEPDSFLLQNMLVCGFANH
jgi:hypothetical protein